MVIGWLLIYFYFFVIIITVTLICVWRDFLPRYQFSHQYVVLSVIQCFHFWQFFATGIVFTKSKKCHV